MPKIEKLHGVNADRLIYARQYYGLSKEFVQNKTKISLEKINGFEDGSLMPSYNELSKLADFYNRPILFFFFKSTPMPNEVVDIAFRKCETSVGLNFNMQVRLMMEKANEYRLNLNELFKDNPPVFSKAVEKNNIKSDEELARLLRNILDLSLDKQKMDFKRSENLLEYIREKFFEKGVYIFKDSFHEDGISGLCLHDEIFPVILLNNKTTFTRQLFTVFHEIYHIWNHEADVCTSIIDQEKCCDRFASKFLVPEDDLSNIIKEKNNIKSTSDITEIADIYKVSPAAIAYRLKELNIITEDVFKEINLDGIRKMNSTSAGGNFYFTRISYLGKPYLKQVYSLYYSGSISTSDVGRYTGLKASSVAKLSENIYKGGILMKFVLDDFSILYMLEQFPRSIADNTWKNFINALENENIISEYETKKKIIQNAIEPKSIEWCEEHRSIFKHIGEKESIFLSSLMDNDEFSFIDDKQLAERRFPEGLPFLLCIAKVQDRCFVYRKNSYKNISNKLEGLCKKHHIEYMEVEDFLLENNKSA